MRDGTGGLLPVIAVTRSFVRRIVIFAEYNLLVGETKTGLLIEVGLHYACLPFDSLCALFFSLQWTVFALWLFTI